MGKGTRFWVSTVQLGNWAGGQEAQGMKTDAESLISSEGTIEDCFQVNSLAKNTLFSKETIFIENIATFNSELWVRHILTPLKSVPTVWVAWFPSRIRKNGARIINNQLSLRCLLGASLIFLRKVLLWSFRKDDWTLCEVAATWFLTGSLWSNELLTQISWKQHLFDVFYYSPKPVLLRFTMSKCILKYAQLNISNLLKQQEVLNPCVYPCGWAKL